jgi:hypothetical protein
VGSNVAKVNLGAWPVVIDLDDHEPDDSDHHLPVSAVLKLRNLHKKSDLEPLPKTNSNIVRPARRERKKKKKKKKKDTHPHNGRSLLPVTFSERLVYARLCHCSIGICCRSHTSRLNMAASV